MRHCMGVSVSSSSLPSAMVNLDLYPIFISITSKGSAFILRWFALAAASTSSICLSCVSPSCGHGLQSLITGSIPLVAKRQVLGCGCKQFTIESSPFNTRTRFVVSLSHIKNEPSSLPPTIYCPLLPKKFASFMSVVVLQCPQNRCS